MNIVVGEEQAAAVPGGRVKNPVPRRIRRAVRNAMR